MWCTGLRKNWDVPDTFPNSAVIKAYKDAKVDQNKDKFTYGRPDLQLLRRFCQDKFGWQQDRADELLVPVLKVFALPLSALLQLTRVVVGAVKLMSCGSLLTSFSPWGSG